MENRRQHYRHEFAPTRALTVRLRAADSHEFVDGEMVNLSLGGVCIYSPGLRRQTAKKWIVALPLGDATGALHVAVERIYEKTGDGTCCGFQFVVGEDAEASEERDKTIWQFLLAEQRRRRRIVQGG